MCLILFAWRSHRSHRLVVAANRDEWFRRPAQTARFWTDAPAVLAGRDAVHGGTWLGVTRSGRFAALTNYREPQRYDPAAPSRGALVSDFLRGTMSAAAYTEQLHRSTQHYNGYSLVACDGATMYCVSNRGRAPVALDAGVYGLSNHLLDTPWPKVVRGKSRLAALAEQDDVADALFALLYDRKPAADEALPDTGLGVERERALSSSHILLGPREDWTAVYGTRCATVVTLGARRLAYEERTFTPAARIDCIAAESFTLAA